MANCKLSLISLAAGLMVLASAPAHAGIDGKEFYMLRCASCHGKAGEGTGNSTPNLAPALKGNPFVVQGSEAALRTVIRKGRSGSARLYNDTYPNMPAFGAEAVPDTAALIAYLKGDMQK